MAWLFSFWHLARITNRAVIAKLIPHHLVSNWNVWWQKRPRGLTDLLHPFLGFSSHVNTFCMFCHPAANDKEPCRNSGGAHPRTPRSAKRHTETQCEFTTKIWKEKKKKDVDKHSGRRAREDRWDILFRLTRCWKKLPFFRAACIYFFFPPLKVENTNFRSVYSGTVVLLWPPAVWSDAAWHHRHCPVGCRWLVDSCCLFI